VLGEQLRGLGDGLFRPHRPVGRHLEDQAVVVGRLADTGLLDREVGFLDRGEDRIDRDHADRLALALVPLGGDVAATLLDVELHPQVTLVRDRRDVEVAVDDLHVRGGLDVRSMDLGRAAHVQGQRHRVLGEALKVELLEVEDDLGHVLFDVRDRGELVRHAIDLDRRDGGSPQ